MATGVSVSMLGGVGNSSADFAQCPGKCTGRTYAGSGCARTCAKLLFLMLCLRTRSWPLAMIGHCQQIPDQLSRIMDLGCCTRGLDASQIDITASMHPYPGMTMNVQFV